MRSAVVFKQTLWFAAVGLAVAALVMGLRVSGGSAGDGDAGANTSVNADGGAAVASGGGDGEQVRSEGEVGGEREGVARDYEPFPDAWLWGGERQKARHQAMVGEPRPALHLEGWMNGEVSEAEMEGKVVVLEFWATWCPPCVPEVEHANEMMREYEDEGVLVVGICSSERGQDQMDEFVERHGIAYPTARDPGERTSDAWVVGWWPSYAIVDREGIVRAVELRPEYVEEALKEVLAGEGR